MLPKLHKVNQQLLQNSNCLSKDFHSIQSGTQMIKWAKSTSNHYLHELHELHKDRKLSSVRQILKMTQMIRLKNNNLMIQQRNSIQTYIHLQKQWKEEVCFSQASWIVKFKPSPIDCQLFQTLMRVSRLLLFSYITFTELWNFHILMTR